MNEKTTRRSGAKIMASLITLLGSLAYIMVLAVINGSLGFVCAMSVTLFGAVGVAKALGETVALSYGMITALAIGCGILRGLLRYAEQYGNHYIAFGCLQCCAIRYSERYARSALQSSKVRKRAR